MPIHILANPNAEQEQRKAVREAMKSFLGFEEFLLADFNIEGSHLYIAERGEYWFHVRFIWTDQANTVAWCHVFADMATFDRMTGSPDPDASHGFRAADSLEDIWKGEWE